MIFPFDQYQRYKNTQEIIERARDNNETFKILEVGSHEHQNLEFFLPTDHIKYLDTQLPEKLKGSPSFIEGDATDMPFDDRSFDIIVALDVFEHVSKQKRKYFLDEINRVSKKGFILSAPFNSEEVNEAEKRLNEYYKTLHHTTDFIWLKEHFENELPDLEQTKDYLNKKEIINYCFQHGSLDIWERMMRIHLHAVSSLELQRYRSLLDNFYNQNIYKSDYDGHCYRNFIVSFDSAKLELITKSHKNYIKLSVPLNIKEKFLDLENSFYVLSNGTSSNNFIKLNETRINELEHRIKRKDDQIRSRDDQIRSRDDQIRSRDDQIRSRDDQIRSRDDQIRVINTHIKHLEDAIKNKDKQIIEIYNTLGWRTLEKYRRIRNRFYENNRLYKALTYFRREGFRRTLNKIKEDNNTYKTWILKNEPSHQELKDMAIESCNFNYRPKVSIITPVYNTEEKWIRLAIESVINQTYDNWELCIADGNSSVSYMKRILREYQKNDNRIKVIFLNENKGIAGNSNKALSLATGDFIGLLDHDDELSPFALYEVVKLLNNNQDIDFIYSDEDKINKNNERCEYFFKPDWSPHMFLSCMYTCHLGVYRKKIIDEIDGFRANYDGSQDYDLVLRFSEKTDKIYHIPRILYHWRKIPGSAALTVDSKSYAYDAAKKALSDAMKRRNIPAKVYDGLWVGSYNVRYELKTFPKISIIIPTKDQRPLLQKCIDSILYNNSYTNYEILIINNNSIDSETNSYLSSLSQNQKFCIIKDNNEFNFSAINNRAVQKATGDVLLFLNNDCEIRDNNSLNSMVENIQQRDVGAVGAKLLFKNGKIQHCGIILGLGSHRIAGHHSYKIPENSNGYFGRNNITHNVSAVTAAAMMVPRKIFEEVNGFDENLKIAYNDVDFCLKLREKGYLVVFTPYAVFYHHESQTRGYEDTLDKRARFEIEIDYFRKKWNRILVTGDPYYNPNLTLDRSDFSLRL